ALRKMPQRSPETAAIAYRRFTSGNWIDRNDHVANLCYRRQNAVREEADVGPDASEQAGENRSFENAERMIDGYDRRATSRDAQQIDIGHTVRDSHEVEQPVRNRTVLAHRLQAE